jgi:ParB family chromosome partitioning protein
MQEQLARTCSAENWSVRMLEEAVRQGGVLHPPPAPVEPSPPPRTTEERASSAGRLRPPGILELEQLLEDRLSTRVSISGGERRGTVVIEFAGLEDLERIYRIIDEHGATAE